MPRKRARSKPTKQRKLESRQSGVQRPRLSRILIATGCIFIVWLVYDLASLPNGSEFKTRAPDRSALMTERINAALLRGSKYKLEYEYRTRREMAPELARAVLLAEDAAFFDHTGFDWHEIGVAIEDSLLTDKRTRGASTITQQLARNLYLGDSRSLLRKLREAVITYKIEHSLSKSRILELYLNIVEWGPGIFGAQAAAKYHFGVSANKLTANQAATLAAILPNPLTLYNPKSSPARVARRREMILNRIKKSRVVF